MKIIRFILMVLLLMVSSQLYSMPPHPDVVDQYQKDGQLKSLMNRVDSLSNKTNLNLPSKSFPAAGTIRVPVLLVKFAVPYEASSELIFYKRFINHDNLQLQGFIVLFVVSLLLIFKNSFKLNIVYLKPLIPVYIIIFVFVLSCGVPPEDDSSNNFSTDSSVYSQILNGDTLSVKKYYQDMSQGNLNLIFDVYGPVTVSKSWDYYGENDGDGNDLHAEELASEALRLLVSKNSSVDFSVYDSNDADTLIDAVIIIHQGPGEEVKIAVPSLIWSHQWTLASPVSTGDGVSFYVYTMQPEYTRNLGDSSMGVFAHEFGHVLGLPDLYDTSGEIPGTHGVGIWSLMAGGAWKGPGGSNTGTTPAPLLAWERNKLGGADWVTINDLTLSIPVNDQQIQNIELSKVVYKVMIDNSVIGKEQYLLIEGKALATPTQWYVVGDGILITHIHEGVIAAFSNLNEVNAGAARVHGVNIIEADGLNNLWNGAGTDNGSVADLFSAGDSITGAVKYNDYTNYTLSSTSTAIDVLDIQMNNPVAGTMTFDVN